MKLNSLTISHTGQRNVPVFFGGGGPFPNQLGFQWDPAASGSARVPTNVKKCFFFNVAKLHQTAGCDVFRHVDRRLSSEDARWHGCGAQWYDRIHRPVGFGWGLY